MADGRGMNPLRRGMIEDMTIRKFASKTQHDDVQRGKNFAAFLGYASCEDVRRYELHLASSGVGVPTINQTVSTLRFFLRVTLKRHEIIEYTHVVHEPRKLPVVLSVEEMARLLDAVPGLKYKAAFRLTARASACAVPKIGYGRQADVDKPVPAASGPIRTDLLGPSQAFSGAALSSRP